MSQAIIRSRIQELLDLAAVLAGTDWVSPKTHLFKDNLIPGPDTAIADFTAAEADFGGYAAASTTFSAPYIDPDGNVRATASVHFVATSGATPNTIYGFFLTNTAGSILLVSGVVDGAPIGIDITGDGFTITLSVGLEAGESTVVP